MGQPKSYICGPLPKSYICGLVRALCFVKFCMGLCFLFKLYFRKSKFEPN
ncbi:hypothetical protein HanIR_Chr12g0596391 [Helianthus annuus]|nr:hypothetical protein HanIR_Chr12g0596391 [Helianthus annuus]